MASETGPTGPLVWVAGPTRIATGELVGVVKAPDAERTVRPAHRQRIDIEIHGQDPEARTEGVLVAAAQLLEDADALRTSAEALAPREWQESVREQPTYPGLFLEGFEFHDDGEVYVVFDYDGMEELVLVLTPEGKRSVFFA